MANSAGRGWWRGATHLRLWFRDVQCAWLALSVACSRRAYAVAMRQEPVGWRNVYTCTRARVQRHPESSWVLGTVRGALAPRLVSTQVLAVVSRRTFIPNVGGVLPMCGHRDWVKLLPRLRRHLCRGSLRKLALHWLRSTAFMRLALSWWRSVRHHPVSVAMPCCGACVSALPSFVAFARRRTERPVSNNPASARRPVPMPACPAARPLLAIQCLELCQLARRRACPR